MKNCKKCKFNIFESFRWASHYISYTSNHRNMQCQPIIHQQRADMTHKLQIRCNECTVISFRVGNLIYLVLFSISVYQILNLYLKNVPARTKIWGLCGRLPKNCFTAFHDIPFFEVV